MSVILNHGELTSFVALIVRVNGVLFCIVTLNSYSACLYGDKRGIVRLSPRCYCSSRTSCLGPSHRIFCQGPCIQRAASQVDG